MKILLIEDEQTLLESIRSYLTAEGQLCEAVSSFEEAYLKINVYDYDVILVDITLPDGNGLEIVEKLKENRSRAGIIIISARNSLTDKIAGLDLGADDYMTKPFHLAELNARIKSLMRRRQFDGDPEIVFNEIRINPDQSTVFVNDSATTLTKKEYELLLYFIANRKRVLTKAAIAEHLWGDNIDSADSFGFVYTHIKNLRKKLIEGGAADYIKTIYGMGYKFDAQ